MKIYFGKSLLSIYIGLAEMSSAYAILARTTRYVVKLSISLLSFFNEPWLVDCFELFSCLHVIVFSWVFPKFVGLGMVRWRLLTCLPQAA